MESYWICGSRGSRLCSFSIGKERNNICYICMGKVCDALEFLLALGGYCGIKMTKRGLWSKEVIQCRSNIYTILL